MAATVKLPELTSREHALLLSALETYADGMTLSTSSSGLARHVEHRKIREVQAEVKLLIEKVK